MVCSVSPESAEVRSKSVAEERLRPSTFLGGTPRFRLRALGLGITAPVYAKAEFFSVGGSRRQHFRDAHAVTPTRHQTSRPSPANLTLR
jgi:hypothetical protein